MSLNKVKGTLQDELKALSAEGRAKGAEKVIVGVKKPREPWGPRYLLAGYGDKEFIKMNSNSYLGMSLRPELIEAEEQTANAFGVGPGAVRFISGTQAPHVALENKLADFHAREAAMIFSSAYVTSLGVIVPLTTRGTVIISDELNHNCIINAVRLSRPAGKLIYKHNDVSDLRAKLQSAVGRGKRALAVTDGVFSMRGDHAPLREIVEVCHQFDESFPEGVITIVDDSHGVGAFGKTGRGTEEYTGARVDLLVGTLGKAFGVNGGYIVSSKTVIDYLRETAPMYIYSNPITAAEAAAALKAVEILDSAAGLKLLEHLRKMTRKFEKGVIERGYETIKGEHPVVPLMIRATEKTTELVAFLTENGVLATGLNFPVVPQGDEEIRFQICADHTAADIDYVLDVLQAYREK